VIQQANNEQVQAVATNNPTVMSDTATPQHYQELVQTNQDLVSSGVSSIALNNIDWGAVNVNGNNATAVDYETWTTTYSDSSVEESRDENDYTLVQQNGNWVISADNNPSSSQTNAPAGSPSRPGPGRTSPSSRPQPNASSTPSGNASTTGSAAAPSSNWAGYAATKGNYTAVTGTWTIPQFNTSNSAGMDATWVGIGGVESHDLIQAGTQEQASGTGQMLYSAWVETLPQASQPVPLVVHAGDSITVSLNEQSQGTWQVSMTNNTTGQQWQRSIQYDSSNSSAEWIEEAPSAGRGGILPLDNVGTVNFTNATAVANGQTQNLSQLGAQPIELDNSSGQALLTTAAVGSDGTSFSVSRTSTADTQPTGRRTSPRSQGAFDR
jgi:hypothetical protein